jgi:tetratricopeptide (TPR) repeat protein
MAEGHWHLGAGRTNEAIEAFERVIQLCKKHRLLNFHPIDALPWLLHALRRRAEELRETDWAESQRLLKRAYRFGKRAVWITRFFPTSHLSTLRELALVYADRGQLRKALRVVEKSLAVAEKQGARYEQAQSALVRGQLAQRLGLEGADDEIQRAKATLASIRRAARKAATAPLT